MRETTLPHLIDPGKWADRLAEIASHPPLSRFTRLLEGAATSVGEVGVTLRFRRDARHLAHLTGQLRTTLQLTCQRCLGPVDLPLAADVDVWLLGNEDQAERLGDEEDYVVCEEGQIDLPALLEDELILALPLVARHDACDAQVPLAEPEPVAEPVKQQDNPFLALAGFKPSASE